MIHVLLSISIISPGNMDWMLNPEMRYRIRRRVGKPTAAVIFRTCRFFPSVRIRLIQEVGIFFLKRMGGFLSGTGGDSVKRATRVLWVVVFLSINRDGQSLTQLIHCRFCDIPFHLHPVFPFMCKGRMKDPVIQGFVICQQ